MSLCRCEKVMHPTVAAAAEEAARMADGDGRTMFVYKCDQRPVYHVTRKRRVLNWWRARAIVHPDGAVRSPRLGLAW